MGEESQAAPTGDQPSTAAPSSSAAEGGGDAGSSMPLIIGGVVVLLILGGVGAFIALSGDKKAGDDESSTATAGGGPGQGPGGDDKGSETGPGHAVDPSKWTYFGVHIGDISGEHGLQGKVHGASDKLIAIDGFSFDGEGPAAFFMAGTTDHPDENGDVGHDITKGGSRRTGAARSSGGAAPGAGGIKKYDNAKVVVALPKPIKSYKYFSVFSKDEKKSYGHVSLDNFEPPGEQDLGPIQNPNADYKVASSANILIDSKQVTFKDFTFMGDAPSTFFCAAHGDVSKDNCKKLHTEELKDIDKQTFTHTLPDDETWDKYDRIAVYCLTADANFGEVSLPSPLKVPVNTGGGTKRRRAVQRRVRLGNSSLKAESGTGKPRLLVCTFGEFGVKSGMIPSDGMCDVMFYTDVEYDSKEDAIVPKDGGPAFQVLKSAAKKYTKTTFGTSMSTGTIADTINDKKDELTASMEELFKARLVHFGMLNVENIEKYATLKSTDLQFLKVAADFRKTKTLHRRYHTALGISVQDASKGNKVLEVAKRAPRDFPGLTMIVVKLHTDNTHKGGDHWPVAPNPDGLDLTDHNALTLASIRDDVKKQLMDIAGHGRYAMLSFAMYARTYRMKATWQEVSERETSESSLNMDYSAVCKMKAERDISDSNTLYAADKHRKFLALFDSSATFKTKTKARLSVMPKNFTGLAVYNVEMDDYKNTCGKGRFARLRAIKAALAA